MKLHTLYIAIRTSGYLKDHDLCENFVVVYMKPFNKLISLFFSDELVN